MTTAAKTHTRFDQPRNIPQLRQSPFEGDGYDAERCEWAKHLWHSQDEMLRQRDRQVEQNVRMLHGQQWIVWSEMRGRFVNLADMLKDDEKRWRHMPVLNRLFLWYVLLHARMTENPPVLSWQAGPDRIDAMLAEVIDPVYKHLWYDVEMVEVLDRMFGWLIPSGRAHLKSRVDPTKGEPIGMRGPATLSLLDPTGDPIMGPDGPIERQVDDFAFGPEGEPLDEYSDPDHPDAEYEVTPTERNVIYEGGIEVDVLTCLEVRGEWGEQVPWHKKAWHMHRTLLTPMQVYEEFGVELEPDTRGDEAEQEGILHRLIHGSGLFGATDGKRHDPSANQDYVTIYELWHRPTRLQGWERTPESPGGRLLVATGGGKVIRDGVRPHPFRYTSPIRTFDFVNLPGRPQGTSPQEPLNGPIRTRNRLTAQGLGVATLQGNPMRVVDKSQGLERGQIKGVPGEEVLVDRSRSKAKPVEYVSPGDLGKDVYEWSDRLAREVDQIGQIAGTEATPPTKDASGELVKELRFNSDRPIAATMRRVVTELGRMAEDWITILPTIWDQEKIITVSGDDGIARTLTVWPMLFEQGNINVRPEIESMLPESRGERQARAFQFWQSGVWGDPQGPQAIQKFLDEARFPHMSRLSRPGGADRSTAEQNVGLLLKGQPAESIPVLPWYDFDVHLNVLETYMKSPEFLKTGPQIQGEFAAYWELLRAARIERLAMDAFEAQMAQNAAGMPPMGGPAGPGAPKGPMTEGKPQEDMAMTPSDRRAGPGGRGSNRAAVAI